MDFQTPDSIIDELARIRSEASKGVEALYAVEKDVAELSIVYDRSYASAFLNAVGTDNHRKIVATVKAEDDKLRLELAKAQLNRVKTKLKVLQDAQTSLQTQARMVELMYRTS